MRPETRKTTVVALAALALVAVTACQPHAEHAAPEPAAPAAPDYAAEYGPVIDTLFEVWNSRELDRLDGAMAADYQRVAPDQNADSLEGMKAFMTQAWTAYPDFAITSNERAYGPGIAFVEWTVTATDSGEGGSGNPIEVSGTTLLRFADGKMTHEIVYYDTATVMRQAGGDTVPHAK